MGVAADGEGFVLPAGIATQATAILGIRGSGKTVTATVAVEELLKRGLPVAVIDPTDVWWGLKSSGDDRSAGFPVVVLGGPHGDLPLEEDDARALADFAVEEHVPLILSLRHLRKNGQRRFATDFCEQLYHRKGELAHRTPLLVVIDEASTFVPQKVGSGEARMVGAVEDLLRRGRAAGIGVALVDQRPASLNKDVLTQVEVLVSHQITSPQDRKALDEWVRQHDTAGHRREYLEGLPSLARGTAWFWSPALDIFELVRVKMRETYDSSKTPAWGADPEPSSKLAWAKVDLKALRDALLAPDEPPQTETTEDPRTLRKRVRELERELRRERLDSRRSAERAVEGATSNLRRRIEELEAAVGETRGHLSRALEALSAVAGGPASAARDGEGHPDEESPPPAGSGGETSVHSAVVSSEPAEYAKRPKATGGLPEARARILSVLRDLEILGVGSLPRQNLAVLAGQGPRSSAFRDHVASLAGGGLVSYPKAGEVALTDDGRARWRAFRLTTRTPDARGAARGVALLPPGGHGEDNRGPR